MKMHITDEQLCAYLDDELDQATRAQVEQALAEDAQLKAKVEGWTTQTGNLRSMLDAELDEPLPDAWLQLARKPAALKPASAAQPRANPSSRAERLMRWMPSPRIAAGMSIAVILGIFVGRDVIPRLDIDGQLVRLAAVAHHVYAPDGRRPVEVRSEDPTLTPWLSKRLGAKVLAPDMSGYHLMGGRLLAGAEEPAGQFMYEETSGKRLTVFVRTEGADGRVAGPECGSYRGVTVCYWYAGGVAYALAGEVPQARLSLLAASAAGSIRTARP